MKLILKIDMNNATFEDFPANEVMRILHSLGGIIHERGLMEAGHNNRRDLYDLNGNEVGFAGVYEDDKTAIANPAELGMEEALGYDPKDLPDGCDEC